MRTGLTSVLCMNGRNKPLGHIRCPSRLERVKFTIQSKCLAIKNVNELISHREGHKYRRPELTLTCIEGII